MKWLYKNDECYRKRRLEIMKKSRHPKHPGHGPKISATRKKLYAEGVLSV